MEKIKYKVYGICLAILITVTYGCRTNKKLKPEKKVSNHLKLDFNYIGLAVQKKGTHVWGTSPVVGKDGKVHLYVAQWPIPRNKKEGFSCRLSENRIKYPPVTKKS